MGGGGGGGGGTFVPFPQENYPAKKLGEIGETTWNNTIPLRSDWLDIFSKFMAPGNNFNVSNLPGYAANYALTRGQTEDAYNTARQNILSSTPRGGAMYGNLSDLELNRAKNLGNTSAQLTSTFAKDLFDKAYNTGWIAAPNIAIQGLGAHAADTRSSMNTQTAALMQAQQMEAAQNAAASQSKGSGMGLLGSGLGALVGLGMAPMTGGTSLFGSGMSALGGLGSGKGGGIINQPGFTQLAGSAQPLWSSPFGYR